MEVRIENAAEKKLIGLHLSMSLADNKTFELWSSFMPRRHEIVKRVDNNLISMQVYTPQFSLHHFTASTMFEKWAAVEVHDFKDVPVGMAPFILSAGLYTVFLYKGLPAHFEPAFNYIFKQWLPASVYEVDNRPHFELLGAKYENNSPDSEEEIWVPVKLK